MCKDINDIPVIKTFFYNNKYYLYDTYTNRLLEVSKSQFMEIKELKRVGINAYLQLDKSTQSYRDIEMLINKGMMKYSFIETIEHPATKYASYLTERCVSDITLQVTKDCNFCCRYCIFAADSQVARNHEKKHMTWEIAKRTIDYLYDHSKDAPSIEIGFYGGEPMLNFKLIADVVEYVEQRFFSKKIRFLMTINGSILTDDVIDFLVNHDFHIAISFDGPPDVQNRHRKFLETGQGTYDVVYSNIIKIRNKNIDYFNNNVKFIPVAFEDENQNVVSKFFKSLNVSEDSIIETMAELNGIDYNINPAEDILSSDANRRETGMQKYINDYISIYNDKSVIPVSWHHNGPCVPSLKKMMVCTDGSFSICEKCLENQNFLLGNVFDGLNLNRVLQYLNIGKLTDKECKTCWAMRFCRICALFCMDFEKGEMSHDKKLIACYEIKNRTLEFFKKELIDKFELKIERK
jgi:uncharacterized protein